MGNVTGNASTVHAPDDSEMIMDKESLIARRGTYPNDTLSIKNTMVNNPGVMPGLHIEKPIVNRFRD